MRNLKGWKLLLARVAAYAAALQTARRRCSLTTRLFVHLGRVEVVGEVTSNQILGHDFACNGLVAQVGLRARSFIL
jgi:hypothetical protein